MSRRRLRGPAPLAVLLLACLAVAPRGRDGPLPPTPVGAAPVPSGIGRAASTAPAAPGLAARAVVARQSPPSVAPAVAMPAWDLCGLGRLPVPPGTAASAGWLPELPAHLGSLPTAEGAARTLARLRQGTPRQRAAALALERSPQRTPAAAVQLAELALAERDPLLLSWAATRCQSVPACAAAAARGWAEVEPANAAAWLAVLNSDPARAAEARAQLATAQHFSIRWGSVTHEAMQAVPPDTLPYLQVDLSLALNGDADLPNLTPLLDFCRPAPATGSDRLAQCRAVVQMLVERSDSLLAYFVGTRLADSTGWPPARLAAIRAERKRIEAVTARLPFDTEQPMSCASVERYGRFLSDRARLGELGYLKREAALQERR